MYSEVLLHVTPININNWQLLLELQLFISRLTFFLPLLVLQSIAYHQIISSTDVMVAINGGTDYSYICYVAGTTMTWTYHTQFPVSSQFCVWRAFKQYQLCLVIKSIQHYVGWNNVKAVLISGRCLWQGISMKTVHTINHNTITEYKTKLLVHFLSAKYTINILGPVVWTVFVHNKSHLSRARCRVVRILASHSPGLIPPPSHC